MNAACSFVDVPLLGIGSPPSQELHHFTNREQEQNVLRRLLALSQQTPVPHRFIANIKPLCLTTCEIASINRPGQHYRTTRSIAS